LLLRLLLLTISLAAGCLLAEGLARTFFQHLAPRTARITRFWRADRDYGWSHRPGVRGVFETHGVQAFVTINAKGFRGPEVDYARRPDRPRVLVLGDSYVWGFGVNDDEVFTELLRRNLPNAEIVNLGVSGYSTDQELLLYSNEGWRYKADLVVLVVTENDPLGNLLTQQYVIYGKPAYQLRDGALELINQPVPQTPWWKLALTQVAMRSYVLTGVNRYLYSRAIAGRPAADAAVPDDDTGVAKKDAFPYTSGEEITARLIVELRRQIAARQTEGKLLVVFTEDMTSSQEFAEYLTPHDISCLDLEDHMNRKDPLLHLPADFHWNAAGHRRVAEVLGSHLSRVLK